MGHMKRLARSVHRNFWIRLVFVFDQLFSSLYEYMGIFGGRNMNVRVCWWHDLAIQGQTLEMRCVLRWLRRVRHPSLAMQEDRSR